MKAIIKYISLLLFSGLILPFYNAAIHKLSGHDQFKKNSPTQAIYPHYNTSPFAAFFFKEIAEELFPVLKN